jgi:hypothetical protein
MRGIVGDLSHTAKADMAIHGADADVLSLEAILVEEADPT